MRRAFVSAVDRARPYLGSAVGRNLARAVLTVGGLTIAVKGVAMAKEMTVAHMFGTTDVVDAFIVAYLLPSLVTNVVSGSFQGTFLPAYVRVRQRSGPDAAYRLYGTSLLLLGAMLTAILVPLTVAGPALLPHMATTYSPEKIDLCERLLVAVMPVVYLSALSLTWGAMLNSSDRFALAAVSPLLTSLATIGTVWVLGPAYGSYSLVLGLVVGGVCEAALLGGSLVRSGISVFPRWHGVDQDTKDVFVQFLPMVAGMLLTCSSIVVDQTMASWLEPGSVATLNYANKVVAVAMGIGSGALSTSLFPHFSRLVALRDWRGLDRTVRGAIAATLGIGIPVTLALILVSRPLVEVLYHRGAFTEADATHVAAVQAALLLQVPFQAAAILSVRLILALQGNRLLFWGAALNLVVDVVMNLIFMHYWGLVGIGLSTSVVCLGSFTFLFLTARHLMARRMTEEEAPR